MCQITLGRIIIATRRNQGLSQREFSELISRQAGRRFDFTELSKIENDRVDVRSMSYDWFVQCFYKIFDIDKNWLEQIRQQTEPQPLDLSQAIFPIYVKNLI